LFALMQTNFCGLTGLWTNEVQIHSAALSIYLMSMVSSNFVS